MAQPKKEMLCPFCEYEMDTDDRYECPNCNGEGLDMPAMTPAERKRLQRERDAKEGIREVCVRVRAEDAAKVREFVARLNNREGGK